MKIFTETKKLPLNYEELSLIKGSADAYYDAYILKNTAEDNGFPAGHPCIIVCPGGGYAFTSDREADPIAIQFTAKGFSAFVLRYSCKEAKYPCALAELSWLIKYIRNNAEEYQIDPNKIAVIGFSAGAHLTASLGAYWNDSKIQSLIGATDEENKPNALILSYPVITGGDFTHKGSVKYLFGEDKAENPAIIDKFSIENHVTPNFPATFIWHTASDNGVPVENSLLLSLSLSREKIPFELRIYPKGPHGLALANEQTCAGQPALLRPRVAHWIEDAISFTTDIAFSVK